MNDEIILYFLFIISLLACPSVLSMNQINKAIDVVRSAGSSDYLKGKIAVVTGGNSGIGLETCKALSSAGCRVILCSRSVKVGNDAVKEEIFKNGIGGYSATGADVVVRPLDLASLASINAFAKDLLSSEPRIDFLVLNAGIMALPSLERTEDGFEKQIGVNHYGHSYMTQLLLPRMIEQQSPSCIVVLASTAHSFGEFQTTDLNYRTPTPTPTAPATPKPARTYQGWDAYKQSKAANILFAKALADRLAKTAPYISTVSVHPGVIRTNLWRASLLNRVMAFFIRNKSIPEGAATTVWACLSPSVSNPDMQGAYLSDCRAVSPSTATCRDLDGQVRETLWNITQEDLATALSAAGLPTLPDTF